MKKIILFLITVMAICTTCVAQDDSAFYYYKKANVEDSLDEYATAIADFNRSIQLDAGRADAWIARGNVRCKLKDYYGALADCNKGVQLGPDNAVGYNNRGTAYINLEDYKSAIPDLNMAIKLYPRFAEAYLNRAICRYYLTDMDKCKADLDTLRMLYPDFWALQQMTKLLSDYYGRMGWEKYGKNGMYPEAIVEIKKGLALNDTSSDLWYNLGGAYYSNKQYTEAKEAFKKALFLDPDNDKAQNGVDAAEQMIADEKGKAIVPKSSKSINAGIKCGYPIGGLYILYYHTCDGNCRKTNNG